MMEYLRNVMGLLESFMEYTIIQISKEENSKANSLAGLASATDTSLNRLIPLEFLPRLSINEKESGKPLVSRPRRLSRRCWLLLLPLLVAAAAAAARRCCCRCSSLLLPLLVTAARRCCSSPSLCRCCSSSQPLSSENIVISTKLQLRTVEEQGLAFGGAGDPVKEEERTRARAREQKKIRADRQLREEQDAAYLEALKLDRENGHHCRKTFAANRGNTTNLKNHLDRCRSYQHVKVEGYPKQQVLFRQKGKDKDDGVVKHEKWLLKSVLGASKQRVCITTDTWTSIQMSNYMVITAHFIDAEWVLYKRILSFTLIANHKRDGIGKLIETCLIDWGIERLFTITVDNASANKVAITYVKKKLANWSVNSMILNGLYMHVRCSAHIINLIVQDGLAEVNHLVASIRNAVKMKEDDGHYVNWFVEDEGEKKREGPPSDDDWGNARRKVEELKSNIKELLMKLYNSYIGGSDVRNSGGVCCGDIHDGSSGGGGGASASSSIMSIDLFSSFKMMKQSSNDDISSKNYVEKYLTDANESTSNAHFDILTWWKLNGHRYPILSQIAKDVLAIPMSTVASESAFSTRGRVLDPFRSSLTHKIVESLICTQNWLRSTLLGEQIIQPT
ncbi:BED-type domain-containing protein [Citrus sinensis]|nr:BED-type domain-containing protein [Citrus sinensis]